jgi:hypothetical protein
MNLYAMLIMTYDVYISEINKHAEFIITKTDLLIF